MNLDLLIFAPSAIMFVATRLEESHYHVLQSARLILRLHDRSLVRLLFMTQRQVEREAIYVHAPLVTCSECLFRRSFEAKLVCFLSGSAWWVVHSCLK